MANLGNAWHIPNNPEPAGHEGMRDPLDPIAPGDVVTIFSGNQSDGDGNRGNQLQDGSTLFFKLATDAAWTPVPMRFDSAANNNKYYSARLPTNTLQFGDVVQYYLKVPYSDHDTTFLSANGDFSVTVPDEATARAAPFTLRIPLPSSVGLWSGEIKLSNVPIHTHVLPSGKVLYWGRRKTPGSQDFDSLNEHETHAFIWDPATGKDRPTLNQPLIPNGTPAGQPVNLFCSGHTFLPDGRLMVVGGHLFDSLGANQATIFDHKNETWTASTVKQPPMTDGRWYPSVVTLADGRILVCSGSYGEPDIPTPPPVKQPPGIVSHLNDATDVWDGTKWNGIADFQKNTKLSMPLFPRLHVAPDGRLFMAGGLAESFFIDTTTQAGWTFGKGGLMRKAGMVRDYAPSVMYDTGKVVFIGGGLNPDRDDASAQNGLPTTIVESIDLNVPETAMQWTRRTPMKYARRQHNATILPDGTVLVTGGTRGGRFNNLDPGQPVHHAELWDPINDTWSQMTMESFDRCYHSTAVLLPDATVLSGGGGEYAPQERPAGTPNFAKDSLPNAQLFFPPYLFQGANEAPRPKITAAPNAVVYGQTFTVAVDDPNQIGKLSWIRLPSVTHAFDQNQRLNFLDFVVGDKGLNVTAPPSSKVCPPGHYMLFALNKSGVPSIATIIQITAAVAMNAVAAPKAAQGKPLVMVGKFEKAKLIAASAKYPPVRVGVTATCPYGLSACWGGAHEALQNMPDVDIVRPYPNSDDSIALVYLNRKGLPDLEAWAKEFARFANGIHHFRGVEARLQGTVEESAGRLFLPATADRPEVTLVPIRPEDKIQWDHPAMAIKPITSREARAYQRLLDRVRSAPAGPPAVKVIGPLKQHGASYELEVRVVEPQVKRIAHAPLSQLTVSAGARVQAAQPGGLAPGFKADPRNDLSFNRGRTIADLTYLNFFIGTWAKSDRANIDDALAAVMTDPGLNDILSQYFPGQAVRAKALPSRKLPDLGKRVVNRTDVETLVRRLHSDGQLGSADLQNTVFNLLLPRGVFLLDDDGAVAEDTAELATASNRSAALVQPHEDDADDSRAGLGGYHGSITTSSPDGAPATVYYAVGVFSENAGGVRNGIPVFPDPWKNVVATFYHELTEARTDPDVEAGNATGNTALFGWVNANGEIGDIPIDLTADISQVIKEIRLADGRLAPVQLMYSNRVHGPEQPASAGQLPVSI